MYIQHNFYTACAHAYCDRVVYRNTTYTLQQYMSASVLIADMYYKWHEHMFV
jgi:hypothetical protein